MSCGILSLGELGNCMPWVWSKPRALTDGSFGPFCGPGWGLGIYHCFPAGTGGGAKGGECLVAREAQQLA